MYDEIIFTGTIKYYYFRWVFQHFDKEIKSQGLLWGQKNIEKKNICKFFKNPSPSEAAHIDLCFTWVDGYGGRAGGLH